MTSHVFSNINDALPALAGLVLNGAERDSRNGKMREQLMVQTTLAYPGNGYLTDPERKASLPAQIAETMWLLAGRNDVEWLSHYLPRAAEFSDDGKTWRGGYGPRIRKWSAPDAGDGWVMDQLHHVVQLLTEDPNTRRAVINIYDPTVDSAPGKDIPCNNWVHFIARDGSLQAHVAIRSNDLMWGFSGINHFEWTQLLNIVAALTGLVPGPITFSASSLHLYEPYWPKAMRIARGAHTPGVPKMADAPQFTPKERSIAYLDQQVRLFFELEALIRNGQAHHLTSAKMDEPLFRSWLQVLYTWHNPISPLPQYLRGTDLEAALDASPRYKHPAPEAAATGTPRFKAFVQQLHADKHAAYGDSWMRRGEQMGIMANIARKVDRLGVAGGGDTSADTAIDLLAYLVKYDLWLQNMARGGVALTGPQHLPAFNARLQKAALDRNQAACTNSRLVGMCKSEFDNLETLVREGYRVVDRRESVDTLLQYAYPLAMRLWIAEHNETRSWNPEKVDAGA